MQIRYEVTKVMYRDDRSGYTVCKGKFKEFPETPPPTSELNVVGCFPSIMEEDEFESEGNWVQHKLYGYQFSAVISKRLIPETHKGLVAFIQKFVNGIGQKTAERIVEAFGTDTLKIIDEEWERLLTIRGVGRATAIKIKDKLKLNKIFEEATMFILANGGNYKMALLAFEAFQSEVMVKITENPYVLASVPKIDFLEVDKIGNRLGVRHNDPIRVSEAIMYYIEQDSISKGNLYVDKLTIFNELSGYLNYWSELKGELSKDDIQKGLEILLSKESIIIAVYGDERCVYLAKNFYIEDKIVELLKKHLTEFKTPIGTSDKIDEFIELYENQNGFKFAFKQKKAVHMALTSGVSILTGGPGTGKTQTINSILKCAKHLKPEAIISLCAPTGRASKRMTELTNMDASTIHRLIGLNMFSKDNEVNEIFGDYIIVDESSMVDAYVFYKLLVAINENTRILFVGDHNQLPSVGPGLILRDLINSGKIPVTVLDEIFRQSKDSDIVINSYEIVNGTGNMKDGSLKFNRRDGNCFFMEKLTIDGIQRSTVSAIKRIIEKGIPYSEIQVLLPIKGTDLGVHELNKMLQEVFNPGTFEKAETYNEFGIIREGDRVIQIVNNYDLGVFNGEVGIVSKVHEDEEGDRYICVSYPDKEVEYDGLSADEIMLAYAMTIHKSQGSEFKAVVMLAHSKYKNALNRNVLYTGLTRAKEMIVIIGDKDVIDLAISIEDNMERNSKIKDRIMVEI